MLDGKSIRYADGVNLQDYRLYMGKTHPSVFHNNNISFKFKFGYIYVFCNDIPIIGLKKTRMGVIACKSVQDVGIPIAGILGETSRTISGYLECWIYQRHPEFKNDRNVLYDIGIRELSLVVDIIHF